MERSRGLREAGGLEIRFLYLVAAILKHPLRRSCLAYYFSVENYDDSIL